MNQGIENIELYFDNGDVLRLEEDLFSHFYIANIDNEANEIPYEKMLNTNILYANFMTLKIKNEINSYYDDNVYNKLLNNRNLSEIKISTSNDKTILFNIASSIDPFKREDTNYFDKSFIDDDEYCLLICPYNIKYKNHLFI